MQNRMLKQTRKKQRPPKIPENYNRAKRQMATNEITSQQGIKVKVLRTKFFGYLNQLNSSIKRCKQNQRNRRASNQQKRRGTSASQKSEQSHSLQSRNLRRHRKSVEKRRNFRQNQINKENIMQNVSINNGKSKIQMANGNVFIGEVQQGQIKEGIMIYPDGTQYQGSFKNQKFHGQGRLRIPNKNLYVAVFSNGVMSKKAEIYYKNGDMYKGEVSNYKKDGYGELKLKNGNRYVGDFIQGQITGYGTYYVNQFPTAKGQWFKGQLMQKQRISLSEI